MKKLFCVFFMIINIISFSFELAPDKIKFIENNGYNLFQDKDDTIIVFDESSIIKLAIREFPKKYIEKLNENKNYNFKDIQEENRLDNDISLNSKNYYFANKEKLIQHFLATVKAIEGSNQNRVNTKATLVIEVIINRNKKENEKIFEVLEFIIEESIDEFTKKILTMEKNIEEEYIGILEDISLYSKEKDIIGSKNESENFVEKIDEYLSKIREYKANREKENKENNTEDKGFIGEIDSYLDKIKKYKASKVSFFSNEIPEYNINMSSDGFAYDTTTGKLASGIITKRDYDGIIIFEQKVKDGLADGKHRTYYTDLEGKRYPKTVGEYKKGEKEGTWKEYYINGELQEVAKYENGKLEGEYKSYYRNKKLESEGEFEEGNKEGKSIYYYENGEKKAEGKYKENEKVKKWKYYNPNGKLNKEIRYSFF